MSPLNGLMNHVAELANSENCCTRNVSSRIATLFAGVPLEIFATLQNSLILPFQPIGMVFKITIKALNFCLDSSIIKDFEESLPGPREIMITAYKIVAYAIGTIFTCIIGLINPMLNFRLHCSLNLIHDEKEEASRALADEEASKQREEQDALMQSQIQTMLFAMRQKAAEQERLRFPEEGLRPSSDSTLPKD